MRVLIAPDKFAGTMSAAQAAQAIGRGWRSARPGDELVELPMADGGAGSVDAVAAAVPAAVRRITQVTGPLGSPVQAEWLQLPDGSTFLEAAQACGLALVAKEQRDPMRATSLGVGQLLTAVLGDAPRRIMMGVGGTATVDGGAGALTGLGCHLAAADGMPIPAGGGGLMGLHRVSPPPARSGVSLVVGVDVWSPLSEAAPVFAPQKGADPDEVRALSSGLAHFADVVERDCGAPGARARRGSGAAGGLAFALATCLGAELRSGAQLVAEMVNLRDWLAWADLVITGEGSLDRQSLQGKAPVFVAESARRCGRPVLAVAGHVDPEVAGLFDATGQLGPVGLTRPVTRASQVGHALARAYTLRDGESSGCFG